MFSRIRCIFQRIFNMIFFNEYFRSFDLSRTDFGLTFLTSNAGVVFNLFHTLTTAALASGHFTAS